MEAPRPVNARDAPPGQLSAAIRHSAGFWPRSCPRPGALGPHALLTPTPVLHRLPWRPGVAWDLGTSSQLVAVRRCPFLLLGDKAPFSLFICIFSTNVW